jgi:tRNA(Ile)-lysidine synthase
MAAPSASRRALERRVCQYVRTFGLLHPGERLLLMLSGGPDSMALLQLVLHCERRLGLGLWLAALHVDYGLRGADSTRDRKIVEEACAAHGVELHVVEAPTGMRGANFQQRARDFRYAQARAVAMERGCARIVTAHNRDDQAETILYRLAKYPSPAVLAGMAPLDGDLARPLLCLDAEEVRDYCRLAGITFGEDVTNARPVYARNRLRLRVLPELRAVNPRLTEDLAAAAEIARQERELLDQLAEQAWRRALLQPEAAIESCESGSGSGGAVLELSVEVLQSEPAAVSAACLRRLAQAALGKRARSPACSRAAADGACVCRAGGKWSARLASCG